MYCIQYDEICKKHNFELIHDTLGERVTLEYPADSVPKDTLRLFQNHLPDGVCISCKTSIICTESLL